MPDQIFVSSVLLMSCGAIAHSTFFFFNDTTTTEIYTLSLHDALPIYTPGYSAVATPAADTPNYPPVFTPAKDRKSTRLNSSHSQISYAVFCLKKKKQKTDVALALVLNVIYGHQKSLFNTVFLSQAP